MDAIPLHLKRDKNRKPVKVKQDIENTTTIMREDIYDILKNSFDAGKTKEDSKTELRSFLNTINGQAIEYKGNKNIGIERVISDIDSYGLIWKK